MLDLICSLNPEVPKMSIQLEKKPHRSMKTVIGYHTGGGNKPPCCPKPTFLTPEDFDLDRWLTENSQKKKHSH